MALRLHMKLLQQMHCAIFQLLLLFDSLDSTETPAEHPNSTGLVLLYLDFGMCLRGWHALQ